MTKVETKVFGELKRGTVVNYCYPIIAEDTNFVVLRHYVNKRGLFTEVLNLETFELNLFLQNTKIENQWSIVKEN